MAKRVLVVANRTVAGRKLLDAVRERAQSGDTTFHLVVPQTAPKHGNVIYDDAARDAAQLRVDLAADFLRQEGIELTGEVGDADPISATTDALHTFPADEIIVSTLPLARSGWLRRDLVERIQDQTSVPIHHVVTDVDEEGLAVHVTLVVANRTAGSDELFSLLKRQRDAHEDRIFIAVIPQEGTTGQAPARARDRLHALLSRLRNEGLFASGMIGDPDPYTAIMNALELFTVDEIVISTLPSTKSGWLRGDLIRRITGATDAHVEHVVADMETANA
jgi:hypothetical protein